jgi:hypothetical protein
MTRIKDRYGQMAKGRMAAMEVRRKRAYARAIARAPIIAELRAAGVTSPHGIAKALNAGGVPTATGKGKWHYDGARRILARLKV